VAGLHLRREHLILEVAVRDSCALDQTHDVRGLCDGARGRLLACDAAQSPRPDSSACTISLYVGYPRLIGTGQPQGIDCRIGDQIAD
jgi:hypothetical protein